MPCVNCKKSILSQTPSLIGEAKCNPNCPEDIVCQELLPSSCLFYSGSYLPCLDVDFGDRITDVIKSINSKYYTITSSNIEITESVVDGCKVINLEAPSGQVYTDQYVAATVGGATDIPGFLVDKLSSSDGSIAINTIDPEVSTVNLIAPCATKVKVSDISQAETCGYLVDKFSEGSVLPQADYLTDPNNPTIRFIKQVRTYACSPESATTETDCSPGLNQGVLVNPAVVAGHQYEWTLTTNSFVNAGDITFNPTTGLFKVVKGGIYDLSLNFGILINNSGANVPSYIRVVLNYDGTTSARCISYSTIYCADQGAGYASTINKGVTIPDNTSFAVLLYNYSGVDTIQIYSNIEISFEKVG